MKKHVAFQILCRPVVCGACGKVQVVEGHRLKWWTTRDLKRFRCGCGVFRLKWAGSRQWVEVRMDRFPKNVQAKRVT
jgi:hypothetical protein